MNREQEFQKLLQLLESGNDTNIELGLLLAQNYALEFEQHFGGSIKEYEDLICFLIQQGYWKLNKDLKNIEELYLSPLDNSLQSYPASISLLTNLREVEINHVDFDDMVKIYNHIHKIPTLRELKIAQYASELMPKELTTLQSLTYLALFESNLKELPTEIENLQNLQHLMIANNNLTYLPKEIGNLTNLKYLFADGNKFTSIPHEMVNMSSLDTIHLQDNQLQYLPEDIGKLSHLKSLFLQNNRLQTLPDSIGEIKGLQHLNLVNNNLKSLPKELRNLDKCKIRVGTNPDLVLPTELQNWENIIFWVV